MEREVWGEREGRESCALIRRSQDRLGSRRLGKIAKCDAG